MLLTNGRIHTLDRADRVVDTLLVRGGRVVFAGRRGDLSVADSELSLDLGGRTVLPGLVDGHAHLMGLAQQRLALDVSGAASEEEAAARVAAEADRFAPGEWIDGRGWDQNHWPDGRFPTRASLDRAAPLHPIVLARIDFHATWANSAALRVAGIDRATPDPPGGRILRDEAGEPTGLLIDRAQSLLDGLQPRPSPARYDRAVRDAIAECLAVGLTGVHEMGVDSYGLASYQRLIERDQFPFRVYAAVRGSSPETWAEQRERGPETVGDGRLVVGAFKLVADGALGSRGALLHHPYCDDPTNSGLALLPPDELARLAGEAAAAGFQVCVHAIGDRANTLTLDLFEGLLARRPLPDHRFRVEHAQVLTDADIPRFARLGVLPSMQPTHCTSDMPWAAERLGPERLAGAYAWRSLLATGVPIAGGSDFPVEGPNPFHGLHAAVTRRPLDGDAPDWDPSQRMNRREAVRSFTTWNAYASHQERDLGSLAPGKRADLAVLSADPLACPASALASITPVLTMVAGEVVHQAVGPTRP